MGSVLVWIHSSRDQARPSTRARAVLRPPGGARVRGGTRAGSVSEGHATGRTHSGRTYSESFAEPCLLACGPWRKSSLPFDTEVSCHCRRSKNWPPELPLGPCPRHVPAASIQPVSHPSMRPPAPGHGYTAWYSSSGPVYDVSYMLFTSVSISPRVLIARPSSYSKASVAYT